MSKRRFISITICCVLAVLMIVAAVVFSFPAIVRWSIPHIVHAVTGLEATVSTVEVSVRKPSLVIEGIGLRAGPDHGPAGTVEAIRLSGAWTNPLQGSIFTPESLDVRGVDVELPEAESKRAGFAPGDIPALLFRFRRLAVQGPRVRVHFPQGSGDLTDFSLTVSASARDGASALRTIAGKARFAAVGDPHKAPWKGDGEMSLQGTLSPAGKAEGTLRCVVKDVSAYRATFSSVSAELPFSLADGALNVGKGRVDVTGLVLPALPPAGPPFSMNLNIAAAQVSLTRPYDFSLKASVAVGDLFGAELETTGSLARSLDVAAKARCDDVAKLLALPEVAGLLPVLPDLTLRAKGPVAVDAQCTVPLAPLTVPRDWRAEAVFLNLNVSVSRRDATASCTLADTITAEMHGGRLSLNGSLALSDLSSASPLFKAGKGRGSIVFSGTPESISVSQAEFVLPGVTLLRQKPLTFGNVQITAGGSWDRGEGKVREVSGRITLDRLGPFQFSLASLAPVDATVRAERIAMKAALPLLETLYPFLRDWTAEGNADLNLRFRENESLAGTLTLDLESLSAAGGTYVAEKCIAGIDLKGKLRSFTPTSLTANARMGKGEALLKGLYLDFSATPFVLDVSAVPAGEGLSLRRGSLEAENLVSATFASQGASLFPLDLKGRVEDLAGFADRFVKPSFSTRYPRLDALQIKGSFEWESTLTPTGVEGGIHLLLSSLETGGPLTLNDAKVDLPIAFSFNGTAPPGAERQGSISIGQLRTERFHIRDQEIRLSFKGGNYRVAPLRFPLEGGIVVLSGLVVGDPFSAAPSLSMGVTLRDIPIGPLDLLPPPYKLEGTVNSREFEVKGSLKHLETNGNIIVDMFGGRAEVFRMAADDVLSPYRTFSCTVEFGSLDMERLTRALSFGRITGNVSGFIRDLTIANGQPESFSFQLASVKTGGVPQKVSFNAVSDIQTISQGDAVGISLPLGLERFINELGYDRIGISCVLKNDAFRINGLIHKGGKEYFVSRSGVAGIDVVNVNPENQISFNDMVDRVRRVAEKRAMEVK